MTEQRNESESIAEQEVKRKAEVARKRRNKARRERDQALRDLGLVKVRGAQGGVYWE